jgi:hypothetical protein
MNEPSRVADAGVISSVVDAGVREVVDAGVEPAAPDAGFAVAAPISDAGFAAPAPTDAGFMLAPVVDAGPRGRTLKKERNLDRLPERGDRLPPQKEFRTLKEQVDYLKQYCSERVSCAKPTIEKAANIAQLSPDETKALINEIPRCISRCQKPE